jgi:AcrR family transcriptional regulator
MSKTKAKILTQARELFNTYGVAVVSQRKIAEEMGISPGNLTYHFPKKDDINEALYYALVEEISRQVEQRKTDAPTLSNLFLLYGDIYDAFHRYRFVFLDFVHFMKSHGQIAEHYQQLQLLRKFQFDQSVELLIFQGLVRPAELDREYDCYLLGVVLVLADLAGLPAPAAAAGPVDVNAIVFADNRVLEVPAVELDHAAASANHAASGRDLCEQNAAAADGRNYLAIGVEGDQCASVGV